MHFYVDLSICLCIYMYLFVHLQWMRLIWPHMLNELYSGTESIQTPLNCSLFVSLQPFAKIKMQTTMHKYIGFTNARRTIHKYIPMYTWIHYDLYKCERKITKIFLHFYVEFSICLWICMHLFVECICESLCVHLQLLRLIWPHALDLPMPCVAV